MTRAIIALVTATVLTMSGLTIGPALRANALGETSVTLNCDDGTSRTLLVDADVLAQLTAAVQAMIDYPAGLSCTLIQNPLPAPLPTPLPNPLPNPLPLGVSFGHVALAAVTDDFIVDGGRWLARCSLIVGQTSSVPFGVVARSGKGPAFASRITAVSLASAECPEAECVWVNIGVNLHFTGNGTLQGTLNETIPENQFCTGGNGPIAVGPSHFTSKPTPPNRPDQVGCLRVDPTAHKAAVITYVTQISGLEAFPGVAQGFFVRVGDPVRASFFDSQRSPSQQETIRDMLNAPPALDLSDCPTGSFFDDQRNVQQNGNINVRP